MEFTGIVDASPASFSPAVQKISASMFWFSQLGTKYSGNTWVALAVTILGGLSLLVFIAFWAGAQTSSREEKLVALLRALGCQATTSTIPDDFPIASSMAKSAKCFAFIRDIRLGQRQVVIFDYGEDLLMLRTMIAVRGRVDGLDTSKIKCPIVSKSVGEWVLYQAFGLLSAKEIRIVLTSIPT